MSNEILVKAEGVSKKFCRSLKRSLWYGVKDVSSELFGARGNHDQLRFNEFWAVHDVSFELRRGECLGLIGPNGAGKSTLLKVLNGLIKPDAGRITMRGRVGALIELGAGFNPILTARENIYVNGSILGFSKHEIDLKFDEIIDFAEIDDFIDMPVQNFSSGMKVRLGFAIASQMEPDVLLIDEVLAVGDVGFRSKCYNAIHKISQETAIIFVSHNPTHIGRLCTKGVVMDHGTTYSTGPIFESLRDYEKLTSTKQESGHRSGSGEIRFESITFQNGKQGDNLQAQIADPLSILIKLKSEIDIEHFVIDIAFLTASGEVAAQCNNFVYAKNLSTFKGEVKLLKLDIPELNLNPGHYKISALIHSDNMTATYDWMHLFSEIIVHGKSATAPLQLRAEWAELDHFDG